MNEELEFETTMKTGITPDIDRIRQYDEVIRDLLKENGKSNPLFFIGFLNGAITFFFINKLIMIPFALLAAAALFLIIRTKKYVKTLKSESHLREIYTEGLLCPGMIVKTDPLTIMVIADMRTSEYCENQYACTVLEIDHLPGANKVLYEKIPCACMFYYEKGDYHSSFEPHPLYWATQNPGEIRAALQELEEEQTGTSENEWEVLKRISSAYPDLKPGQMLILDASYEPLSVKNSDTDKPVPVVTEQVLTQYPKLSPDPSHITDDVPAAFVYNQMIDLAVKHQVYEYISTHCKHRDYDPLSNPGYFTYISDPIPFSESLEDRKITLAGEEYPLIAGLMLVTTKGCWKKKEFIPWQDITLDAVFSSLGGIETRVNGTCIVEFKPNPQNYVNSASFTKEDLAVVREIELKRIQDFLRELKELVLKNFQ